MLPSQAQHRILLAVCGLNPQIVTETIYALVTGPDDFIPTQIHLITTQDGATKAQRLLLDPVDGWFHRLRKDLSLPEISFDDSHIHVMHNELMEPLNDIRTVEDNRSAADFITATVRRLANILDSSLHVSIAGGRKTMGYYLGYALSLYGRPQDRLSHVLVSEPFENCTDYFYPTRHSHPILMRDGRVLDAKDSVVTLAEIPFVSLRSGIPVSLLEGQATFNQTVQAARAVLSPKTLVLDLPQRCIKAAGITIALPPAELALLLTFALRKLKGAPAVTAPNKNVPDPQWAERYMQAYRMIVGHMSDTDATERALKLGMDGDYFSQRKSKLEKRLRVALGEAASLYCIEVSSDRPRRYQLALAASAITLIACS